MRGRYWSRLSSNGFTLAELLVVILILGVLAGLIFSIASGVFQKGDRDRALGEVLAISVALEAYRMRFGDYPDVTTPRQLFDAMIGEIGPEGEVLGSAFPPFLETGQYYISNEENPELVDPWGHPYEYVYLEPDPQTRLSGYKLFSKGPDGRSSREGDSQDSPDNDNIRYDD